MKYWPSLIFCILFENLGLGLGRSGGHLAKLEATGEFNLRYQKRRSQGLLNPFILIGCI